MQSIVSFFKGLVSFVKEAWIELKQVSWLTVPQMMASTWLVVIMVVVVALYIMVVDGILKPIIAFFI